MPEESKDAASAGAENLGRSSDQAADSTKADQETEADRSPPGASDRIAEPETKISGKDLTSGQRAEVKAAQGHPQRRVIPSDEALALGAVTAGGVLTALPYYVPQVDRGDRGDRG